MLPAAAAAFDYAKLPSDIMKDAQFRAELIRHLSRTTIECIIQIGEHLVEVKNKLQHGQFSDWVQSECRFTLRTAENYIRAAAFAKGKNETVALLPPSVVYKLAAKSAPPAVVEAVLSRMESGAYVDTVSISAALANARHEKREADRKAKQSARRARKSKRALAAEEDRRREEERRRKKWQAEIQSRALSLIDEIGEEHARKVAGVLTGNDGTEVLYRVRQEMLDRDAGQGRREPVKLKGV